MSDRHPLSVEVILPARGATPWLASSLLSLATQTTPPSVITVVDDGLLDASFVGRLGTELIGNSFRLIKSSGRGISAALNTGIQQSSAQWIMRMDADDISHRHRLEKQLAFLQNAPPKVLGCGTQVRFINRNGVVIGRSHLPMTWDKMTNRILSQTCFVHPTLLLRRAILLRTPYRPSLDGAEDLDLILRLSEAGEILNLKEPLLDYRIYLNQESFATRARQTALQELAFRLALSRRNLDPLDNDPSLSENFVQWRLSDRAYVRTRLCMTALRYIKTYLMGLTLDGVKEAALIALRNFPMDAASLHIAWLVARNSGAAMLTQLTPFPELNHDTRRTVLSVSRAR
jgi:glycosyltransferase involved in cell wall biosynthesis